MKDHSTITVDCYWYKKTCWKTRLSLSVRRKLDDADRLSSQHSSSSMSHISNPSQTTWTEVSSSSWIWKERGTLLRNKNKLPLLWSHTEFSYNTMALWPFLHPHPEDNKCLQWRKSSMLLQGLLLRTEKSLVVRKNQKIIHRHHQL